MLIEPYRIFRDAITSVLAQRARLRRCDAMSAIGPFRKCRNVRHASGMRTKADLVRVGLSAICWLDCHGPRVAPKAPRIIDGAPENHSARGRGLVLLSGSRVDALDTNAVVRASYESRRRRTKPK